MTTHTRHGTGALLARLPDKRLVELARAGSDDAFAAIHDRYRRALLGFARRMLSGSGHDAEDVVQDAFARAQAALSSSDDRPLALRAWLYAIVRNRALDYLRRPPLTLVELDQGLDAPGPADAEPHARAARRAELRQLVADVTRLPERQRAALVLHELEGRSLAELAKTLGTTVPASKSLLVRARAGLSRVAA